MEGLSEPIVNEIRSSIIVHRARDTNIKINSLAPVNRLSNSANTLEAGCRRRLRSSHGISKRPENLRVGAVHAGFGVPLDGQGEALSGDFESLYHAVGRGCSQQQAGCYLAGGLMVAGVHHVAGRSQNPLQPAARRNADFVGVAEFPVVVSLDVLLERAAQYGVEQLQASADRQHGKIAVERVAEQGAFETVAILVRRLGYRQAGLAVERRVHIRAAGKAQAVDAVERRDVLHRLDAHGDQSAAVGLPLGLGRADAKWKSGPHTPTRKRVLPVRMAFWSWCGSPSHSMAMVVTGSSGAFSGRPVKRTRNFSWTNFTSLPVAARRADFTWLVSPPSATVSPGQKCTCMKSVLPSRVK